MSSRLKYSSDDSDNNNNNNAPTTNNPASVYRSSDSGGSAGSVGGGGSGSSGNVIKGTLLEIIQDPVYLSKLAEYMRQERCEENIIFWQEVSKNGCSLARLILCSKSCCLRRVD